MLEVADIHARYGSARVLEGISLQVNEGEIVALVGANEAGKTSLVKVITGLLKPVSGTIRFCGRDITRAPAHMPAEWGIGIVPENRRLFPKMSVEENLMVGGMNAHARPLQAKSKEEVYGIFSVLAQRRTQLASTLSGGEQQMLAIGRALMARPELLIFDEPSLGLAPKVVDGVFDTIQKLHAGQRLTVLLIEQNVARSLEISSRAYALENGRMALEGQASDMLRNEHVKRAYLRM